MSADKSENITPPDSVVPVALIPIDPEVVPGAVPDRESDPDAELRHLVKDKVAKRLGLTDEERDVLFGANGDPMPVAAVMTAKGEEQP